MSLSSEIDDVLEPIVRVLSASIETTIEGHLVRAYIQGDRELMTWGMTKSGLPIAYEGPPVEGAINWAKEHISKAKLVDGINAETKKQLAQVISDGIKNKRGIPGLKSDIRHKLGWMARGAPSEIKGLTLASRAEMIARTETASALSQASLDRMEAMGVDGKEWVTVGDDQVSIECQGNEAEGVIPIDQTFSGGVMGPPQHPRCRCAIAPARLK